MKAKGKIIFWIGLLACCLPLVNASSALVLGVLVASVLKNTTYSGQSSTWGGYLLKLAVIGLGFGINIRILLEDSQSNIGITALFVLGILGIGFLLGRFLKLDKIVVLLISAGTAICGGSAIAAVGSVVKANTEQMSVSTGVVFLLNAVALFVFPVLGHWLGLSQEQFGTWAAIAIHDTSSVIGAAAKYGDVALRVASITKMLRIFWIIPVSLILVVGVSRSFENFKIPIFILGFVLASILYSFLPSFKPFFALIYTCSKQLLVLSLYLIGASISFERLRKIGPSTFGQATILWLISCVLSLLFVIYYY
ncbi:Uncharacterized protein family UPF0324 [Emticicia oligotrophica DSM 17448]|uniref:Uncharacterized protein family UPF0324 n=2 Tax=Emticicia TaxID=312278 RepID=A0ABM5N1T4_EMTOG|nr:Uncharacterized protein family UPF0324 [Emticicia oligotrophica DSM 17448]